MKKSLFLLWTFIFSTFLYSCGIDDEDKPLKTDTCKAILSDGSNCDKPAENGSMYCWKHNKGRY